MCGLYGVYSTRMGKKHLDMYRYLAYLSLKRGTDSTGILSLQKEKKENKDPYILWSWARSIHNAAHFLDSKIAKERLDLDNKVALVGHNRAATIGEIHQNTAHPFHHGNIIGFHNGTIKDHDYDPKKTKFYSDSDKLFHLINKQGLEKTTQDIHNGHLALCYFNIQENTLYFVRNHHRPLYFMWSKPKHTLVWASEEDFLNEIKFSFDYKWEKPSQLPVDTLFSIDVLNNKYKEEKVDVDGPFWGAGATGTGNSSYPSASSHSSLAKPGHNSHHPSSGVPSVPGRIIKARSVKAEKETRKGEVLLKREGSPTIRFYSIDGEERVEYFRGTAISLEAYKKLINRECAGCDGTKEAVNLDSHVEFINQGQFLCGACLDDPFLENFRNGGAC